uniref:Uncharacterized protein n=1 Tax=Meloidogyne floridensis TaxID=298350 RepID=A0A915PA26_9BILA
MRWTININNQSNVIGESEGENIGSQIFAKTITTKSILFLFISRRCFKSRINGGGIPSNDNNYHSNVLGASEGKNIESQL